MFKNISKLAIVAAAILALPGMAQAGTANASGTATMSVINQCSVTGANVNLGTFRVNDTWGTVIAQNGGWNELGSYLAPSRGAEYANLGSVTCASGTPYTLAIWGSTAPYGTISLTIAGKAANMAVFVKKVGATTLADTGTAPGAGASVYAGSTLSATGTGTAQALLGSIPVSMVSTGTWVTDKLAAAGTYTDTLTYTLNF